MGQLVRGQQAVERRHGGLHAAAHGGARVALRLTSGEGGRRRRWGSCQERSHKGPQCGSNAQQSRAQPRHLEPSIREKNFPRRILPNPANFQQFLQNMQNTAKLHCIMNVCCCVFVQRKSKKTGTFFGSTNNAFDTSQIIMKNLKSESVFGNSQSDFSPGSKTVLPAFPTCADASWEIVLVATSFQPLLD